MSKEIIMLIVLIITTTIIVQKRFKRYKNSIFEERKTEIYNKASPNTGAFEQKIITTELKFQLSDDISRELTIKNKNNSLEKVASVLQKLGDLFSE